MPGCSIYDVYIDIYNSYINGDREKAIEIHNFILSMLNHIRQNSRMYRYKQKNTKKNCESFSWCGYYWGYSDLHCFA